LNPYCPQTKADWEAREIIGELEAGERHRYIIAMVDSIVERV